VRLGVEALFGFRASVGEWSTVPKGCDAMSQQAQALLATRTVVVRFPNGETEYWLTDRVFVEGETYVRNGNVWEVADVLPPSRNGGNYLTVRLAEGDG
jgi:hypothetical protein